MNHDAVCPHSDLFKFGPSRFMTNNATHEDFDALMVAVAVVRRLLAVRSPIFLLRGGAGVQEGECSSIANGTGAMMRRRRSAPQLLYRGGLVLLPGQFFSKSGRSLPRLSSTVNFQSVPQYSAGTAISVNEWVTASDKGNLVGGT